MIYEITYDKKPVGARIIVSVHPPYLGIHLLDPDAQARYARTIRPCEHILDFRRATSILARDREKILAGGSPIAETKDSAKRFAWETEEFYASDDSPIQLSGLRYQVFSPLARPEDGFTHMVGVEVLLDGKRLAWVALAGGLPPGESCCDAQLVMEETVPGTLRLAEE